MPAPTLDEAAFRSRADEAITELFDRLAEASERYAFEPDLSGGALVIEFDDPPAKFVVSPNAPVRQIWVSANLASSKLDWDEASREFRLNGQSLRELVAGAMSKHLGETVVL